MNQLKHLALTIIGGAFLISCASGEKASLSTADTSEALKNIKTMKSKLEKNNVDLLAHESFESGVSDLREAMDDMQEGDDEQEILTSLEESKAHFQQAKTEAEKNRSQLSEGIIEARSMAHSAGARATADLREKLSEIDHELRDETDNFTEDLSVKELSGFQKDYLALEVNAVQNRQLSRFKTIIDRAEDNDAEDKAPKTLKQAQTDVTVAENQIAQSPRDPAQYKKSVLEANKSAKLLDDVMNKLMGEAKGSPEQVALKLVYQERKLGKLSKTVGNLQGNLAQTKTALAKTTDNLADQMSETLSAKSKVAFQEAMDTVRTNFDKDEAEVYQQGNQLILRLKKLNFKSGSATIPTSSMDLLSKVEGIIKDIEPEKIQIQGHTDSTGGDALNQQLSKKRAKAVAEYLNSKGSNYSMTPVGYGESQPIANNETAKGRKLNRRVDIVIDAK